MNDLRHLLKQGKRAYKSQELQDVFIYFKFQYNEYVLSKYFYHTTETLNYFFRNRVKYINLVTNSNIKSTKYNVINCILKKEIQILWSFAFYCLKVQSGS